MSGLTRWEPFRTQMNPWRELEEVQKRLSSMWGGAPQKEGSQKESISVANGHLWWTSPKTRKSI